MEAEPEQRISTTALDSTNQPLPEQGMNDIVLRSLQFQSRMVDAYSYVRKGYRWSISEERFDRSNLAVAFCDQANITSLLTATGEFQHQLAYFFRTANSQSLLLQFDSPEVELWSVLLNNEPVPVRKSEQGFHISLALDKAPGEQQSIKILYSNAQVDTEATSRIQVVPPQVYVVDGAGATHDMVMVSQQWTLNYPEEKSIVESAGDFYPETSLGDWREGWLNHSLHILKTDFWRRGLLLLGILVILNALILFPRKLATNLRLCVAVAGFMLVLGVFYYVLLVPMTSQMSSEQAVIVFDDSRLSMSENFDFGEQSAPAAGKETEGELVLESQAINNELIEESLLGTEEASEADTENNFEVVRDSLGDSDVDASYLDEVEVAATPKESAGKKSRLSVAMNLPTSAGMNQQRFEYNGSRQGQLSLVLRDQTHDRAVTFSLFAAVLLLFWAFHRLSLRTYSKYVLLAVCIPLALIWLLPLSWSPWLLGTLLGALAAFILKLMAMCVTKCAEYCCPLETSKAATVAGLLLLLFTCSQPLTAQEQASPNQSAAQKANDPNIVITQVTKPAPPSTSILDQPNTYIFLYDDDYKEARKVILKPEQHRQLWEQAYNAAPGEEPKTHRPIIASAGYTADLTEISDKKFFILEGKLVVYSFDDKPGRVLPLQEHGPHLRDDRRTTC
ncbi:MAG: hypothetical protein R3C11_08145 [Planctomycetaceae bacterium]